MQYRPLGGTDVQVSAIGLGTMTFGEQNTEAEGHAQLDYAVDHGVNLIDTAELYAIPPCAETYGRTEEILGTWLRRPGNRERVVLASKIAGPGEWVSHIRGGRTRFDRKNITEALEGSLRRLQTDHIDLYQLHWPERTSNFFGKLGYPWPEDDEWTAVEDTLAVLGDMIKAGKIRYVGLSNETPWGVMKFIQVAEKLGLPKVVSVQNPYSLLNRTFEIGLAEVGRYERVGLLAYSPLGFGVLSGKYLDGAAPPKGRLTLFPHYDRYSNEQAQAATREYVALARDNGLGPVRMALAYVNSRPFLTSTIIGATTMEQLEENIASVDVALPPEVLERIEGIHTRYPNPSP